MSLATGDLTTLANLKAWLGITSTNSDALLSQLITRESAVIRNYLNRSILLPKAYTRQFNGTGTSSLVLPEFPLVALRSLVISGVTIPQSPQLSNTLSLAVPFGWRYQPWDGSPPGDPAVLELIGYAYQFGSQNVVANYTAGYQVSDEPFTVPGSGPTTYNAAQPYGIWAQDEGVTYAATGDALTAIPSGTPAQGQYVAPTAGAQPAAYTFSTADAGQALLIDYGFIPADLEQVAIELCSERYTYKGRIGVRSQSLAGQETSAFDLSGLPAYAKIMLNSYVSVVPPATGANA